ncbi:MAG: alpha/beta hydrolase [Acidimicrobiales bacterium]|jgi:pimeloyl-ACP methyl ester carboxylesterase|nr:alpha/beta hydrolase [Acidimicrobiales bacterium]|tara:strand:- start:3436 stop:4113 length:678 start_codon:yes stop_codon:yes gene_type:complete
MIAGNDGTRIATECRGDGPSLVFTHGWANDRSVWTPIADDLAGDHSVTTWDLRGHGESDTPPPGNYSRQHALGDMNAVVDDTDRPAVLIGHSLGGYLSLAYALEHPDEVSALVLVASGPGFRKVEARDEWNEAVVASTTKLGLPPGVEELSMHVDSMVIDRLTEITAPVLILLGERDRRFAAAASLFQRDLDVRDTVIVPDQGHMVHLKAASQCADAIRSFVTGL